MRTVSLIGILLLTAACSSAPVHPTTGSIERLDPRLEEFIPEGAVIEVLAKGFEWTEGPVWVAKDGGFLLFSDIPNNVIHRWDEANGLSDYLRPAGYTGAEPRGGELGSNGLALDADGKLLLCQHGDRCIARMNAAVTAPKPAYEQLASRWEGKRFNSPNDLVVAKSGTIYFTDPIYGLEQRGADPKREIDFVGVYRLAADGKVTMMTREMTAPNGIALSPDERTLYIAQSDQKALIWKAFPILDDGAGGLGPSRVLFDAQKWAGERKGSCDGLVVHPSGILFATGPGGVLVLTPAGEHLGTILTGQATANCTIGDDGKSLFITADMLLLRVRING